MTSRIFENPFTWLSLIDVAAPPRDPDNDEDEEDEYEDEEDENREPPLIREPDPDE